MILFPCLWKREMTGINTSVDCWRRAPVRFGASVRKRWGMWCGQSRKRFGHWMDSQNIGAKKKISIQRYELKGSQLFFPYLKVKWGITVNSFHKFFFLFFQNYIKWEEILFFCIFDSVIETGVFLPLLSLTSSPSK